MWAYVQRNGDLYKDGVWKARAYSGFGIGKNNPDLQELMDIGPLPTGLWKFVGPPFDSATHGPFCLRILPEPLTQTFGRSAFILHGDNINHLGSSSHGCIVASPIDVREMVWNEIQATGDDLVLVASEPPINQQPEVS